MLTVKQNVHFMMRDSRVSVAIGSVVDSSTNDPLTYMSIRAGIQAKIIDLVKKGELRRLRPLWGEPRKRCLLMSREVSDAVLPWSPDATEEGDVMGEFRGILDDFVIGQMLAIAFHPFEKDRTADMAPNDPVKSGIWDFRVRAEKAQIRCFGGFAAKDTFVALTWNYRDRIGERFSEEVNECAKAWDQLFAPYAPHQGKDRHEYISPPFRAV